MSRVFATCLILALGSAVAAAPPVAPEPRPAAPQIALVVVEEVPSDRGVVDTRRILRVGVRNGKLLPAETIWEGDQRFFGHSGTHQLVANRYFVTKFGGVIDMNTGKRIHDEQDAEFCGTDGTKILYRNTNGGTATVYSFDIATGKAKKEADIGEGKYAFPGKPSPDGRSAVEGGPAADDLVLHQVGAKPKTLGKGFSVNMGPAASTFGPTPTMWLNDGLILTQRGNGKLVTVDVAGKVTDVLTIKDAPKDLVSGPYFFRDGSDHIVYVCGRESYLLDLAKKTATKSEWRDLGHGFEVSWQWHNKLGYRFRHNGKEFAWINCWPHSGHTPHTAPGLLAVAAKPGQDGGGPPECVAVWSVDVGEWQMLKIWPNCLVGWVKP